MFRVALVAACAALGLAGNVAVRAQDAGTNGPTVDAEEAAEAAYQEKLDALHWVEGPTTVEISSNSKLELPEHYVFLDAANTAKYEELNQNLSSGKEVLDRARKPRSGTRTSSSKTRGYVKDDEKIDAGRDSQGTDRRQPRPRTKSGSAAAGRLCTSPAGTSLRRTTTAPPSASNGPPRSSRRVRPASNFFTKGRSAVAATRAS